MVGACSLHSLVISMVYVDIVTFHACFSTSQLSSYRESGMYVTFEHALCIIYTYAM